MSQIELKSEDVQAMVQKVADGVAPHLKVEGKMIADYVKNMQTQLDYLESKMATSLNFKGGKPAVSQAEQKANRDWLVAVVRNDRAAQDKAESEIKTLSGWSDGAMQTGGLGTTDQGAWAVPALLYNQVSHLVEQYGLCRREMFYLPFPSDAGGNSRTLPVLTEGVSAYWTTEAGVKGKTAPKIGKVTQTLEKLAAITVFTDDILEDSSIDLVAFVSQLIASKISEEEDRSFLAGDGITSPFTGIIYLNTTEAVPTAAGTQIADGLTPEVLQEAIYAVPREARMGAKFYMSSSVFAHIQSLRYDLLASEDKLGQFIMQSPNGNAPGTIWGYPYEITEALPSKEVIDALDPAEDPGEAFMFFGNLNRTCVYGDKMGLRVKVYDTGTISDSEEGSLNLAERDMTMLRVHKRVGYAPLLPENIAVIKTGLIS